MKRGQKPLKRTGLARGTTRLQRTPKREWSAESRRAALNWKHALMNRCKRDKEGLYICPACKESYRRHEMQGHHVIEKERLKKYLAEKTRGLALAAEEIEKMLNALLWDVRDGVAVCVTCHRRHTDGVLRLPRACLPATAFEFADEVGLGYVLDRYYR